MVFIESAVFTGQVRELLSDETYAEFQQYLALQKLAISFGILVDCARFAGRYRAAVNVVACG